MSTEAVSGKVVHFQIDNAWQEAIFRGVVSQASSDATFSNVNNTAMVTLEDNLNSLNDLPGGMTARDIDCPVRFPTLQRRQILACHADRLIKTPLIACFNMPNIEKLEQAYNVGNLVGRRWVILTLSEQNIEDFKARKILEL